nr:hypothetical protein [Chloroflexota bacterium]
MEEKTPAIDKAAKSVKSKTKKPKTQPLSKAGSRSVKTKAVKVQARKMTMDLLKAQLAQREDELAILNSVGEAMAKTLDVKTVTKIVGDKVRDIFNADVSIKLLDQQTKLIHSAYEFDKGEGGYVYY